MGDVPKLESEAFKLLGNPFIHKMNVWNHSEHKIKDVIDDVPITYTEYKRSPNPFFADYLGGGLGFENKRSHAYYPYVEFKRSPNVVEYKRSPNVIEYKRSPIHMKRS